MIRHKFNDNILLPGIKTSGKVVYVTAVFPFIALIGLFIMGMTLEGAMEGVKYFFDPTVSFNITLTLVQHYFNIILCVNLFSL